MKTRSFAAALSFSAFALRARSHPPLGSTDRSALPALRQTKTDFELE